jgi:hypothetical protein
VRIEPVKPLRPGVANFAPIYDVLHSARRDVSFASLYTSPEFIAILDFLSARVLIRGVLAETSNSLEAASILADRSQPALRCFPRHSAKFLRMKRTLKRVLDAGYGRSLHMHFQATNTDHRESLLASQSAT